MKWTNAKVYPSKKIVWAEVNCLASDFLMLMSKQNSPYREKTLCKRRIEKDIAILRKDLSRIYDWFKEWWKLKKKHKIKDKGSDPVIEQLKEHYLLRHKSWNSKKSRVEQYRQNETFNNNQKALYEELDGKIRQEQVISDAKESSKFWSKLWDNTVDHGRNAEWIMTAKKEVECIAQQGNVNITKGDASIHFRKIPNCKARASDGLHGFWLKNSLLFTRQ